MINLIRSLLIFILHFYTVSSNHDLICPEPCQQCFKDRLICTKSGLTNLPEKISSTVEKLSITDQTFIHTTLTSNNFTQFEPPHISLKQLILRTCNIKLILSRAFSALTKLESLDLSNNSNLTISSESFHGLKIRHLLINNVDNLVLEKNVFQGLEVTMLSLSNCGITSIDYDTLQPLSKSLSKLILHKNHIKSLEPKLDIIFRPLEVLELSDNKFLCDCNILWLIKLYKSRMNDISFNNGGFSNSGKTIPRCESPDHLTKRVLVDVNGDEIVCDAPKIYELNIKFTSLSDAKLICSGKQHSWKAPMQIAWYNTSESSKYVEGEIFMNTMQSEKSIQIGFVNKIGYYKCVINNSVGETTATVRVNWPHIAKNVANVNEYDRNTLDSQSPKTKVRSWRMVFFEQRFTLLEIIAAVTGTILLTGILFILLHRFVMVKCVFVHKKKEAERSSRHSNLATLTMPANYEPAVYSNSQTYDLPGPGYASSNLYLPTAISSSQQFLDFKTQRKIYRKL